MAQRAFLAVVIGSIIAGLTGIIIKNISVPASSIAFVRTAIPTIILAAWMMGQGIQFFRGNWEKMILASVLNAIRMYLFLTAFIYTSITQAVIMLFTWPIFVNILSTIWLKEKISLKQVFTLVLAFAGIVIIYGDQSFSLENRDFIGMSAGVLSAFFYSISYILYKTEIDNFHRNEIIFYQNLVGSFVFLPFFWFVNPWPVLSDYPLLLTYGILMGIVIFNFFFYGLKYLKASQASMIAYVEIISAVATGIIFMGDEVTTQIVIGGSFILGSIYLIKRMGMS